MQVGVGPILRAVLDEYLLQMVRATTCPILTASGPPKLRNGAHETRVHVVGERSANLTLDDREAMFCQRYLRVFQLLELHKGEVKVLEQRPTQGETKVSQLHPHLKILTF